MTIFVYLLALESSVKNLEERIHTQMLSFEEDKDFNGDSGSHFSCGCDKILNKINLRKQGSIPAFSRGIQSVAFPAVARKQR